MVAAACFLLAPIIVVLAGLRTDYSVLGPRLVWSLTLLQLAASYILAAVALRLVIPAQLPSAGLSAGLVSLAILVQALASVMIFDRSQTAAPSGRAFQLWAVCLLITFALGLLPAIVAFGLGVRGLPLRARLFGLMCGLSAGFGAEAAWRLHCPFSDPAHILGAHGGAILALGLLGLLAGALWERMAFRPLSRDSNVAGRR